MSGSSPTRPDPTLLQSALDALGEGITLADARGRILYSNPAADRILGVTATGAPASEWAKHYGVFIPWTDEPFPEGGYPLVRALKGEETDRVQMLIRNDQNPKGVLISSSGRPVRNQQREIVGAAVVFRDITQLWQTGRELREALESLKEVERQKSELIGFLVHDMKSLLTAILMGADLMLTDDGPSTVDRQQTAEIKAAAEVLHRMVLNMLDIQAAENGRLEPDCQDVRVRELLDTAVPRTDWSSMRFSVDVTGDPVIQGDPELLGRVMGNLIDNCIKYAPRQGAIWLDARPLAGKKVLIRVRDEGPGVPPELRERIFEKYAMVERDASRRRAGSRGLGLRFCKVAVEAHGGRIWVEDNAPAGAAFHVELPEELRRGAG